MPDEIVIKQFELREKDALFSFLREVYADNARQSDAAFWHWHYCESPFASEDNIPLWVAKHGEEIVGQLGAIPVELNVKGKTVRTVWILDLIIRIDFRRHGLAKKLVQAIEENYPTMLGVNTMEQHAPKMLQSIGWVIAGKINRYSKLINPGNSVKEIAKIKPLRAVINGAFSLFRPKYKSFSAIKKIERFNEAADEWKAGAFSGFTCMIDRPARFLNWQYVDQPGKRFDILGHYEGERLLGYVVLFFRKPDADGVISKAAITDICYDTAEPGSAIVDALLEAAIDLAAERGAGRLVTDVVDALVEDRLKRYGFWPVKNPLQLMVKTDEADEDRELLYDIKNWYITRGDSDTSIFEDPNI